MNYTKKVFKFQTNPCIIEKNTKYNLSKELQSLLYKKMFARSNHLHSKKLPPRKITYIQVNDISALIELLRNYILCVIILIMYFLKIFVPREKNLKKNLILVYSLTKEQAVRNKSTDSLITFLKSKGVINSSESLCLVEVRSLIRNKNRRTVKTTIDIPLSIYSKNFSRKLKITCWISMCKNLLMSIKLQNKYPEILLILKEFVFDQIVYSALDPDKVKKLITTQSTLAYQPLIFEYELFKSIKLMIWYSSNSVPLKYKKKSLSRFEINPIVYKYMCIDEHWVWNMEHKKYLKCFTNGKIIVKGSLMFYEAEKNFNSNINYDVVIFDVTPTNINNVFKNSAYTTEVMINFINEILECVETLNYKYNKNYKIYLKHKRRFHKNHSVKYHKFIQEKVKKRQIRILPSWTNLYNLISNSNLVIGFPFTSPVIIGQELKKPSVYFCSSKLLESYARSKKKEFLQNKSDLLKYLEKVIVKKI